jgi:Bacterial aa3 type cytochrome c oxidase subunit IV
LRYPPRAGANADECELEDFMADHGQVEYGTATGNDLAAHEQGYENFVHLVYIGCTHLASVATGFAIGGGTHHWGYSITLFILATIVAAHGLASGARVPSAVMVVISLLTLVVAAS